MKQKKGQLLLSKSSYTNYMNKTEIKKLITSQYPDYEVTSIASLGSGYDSDAYLINDEYVFKFPRHELAARNLYKEAKVLLEIRDQLPIKVPAILFTSEEGNTMKFVGYEKIEGTEITPEIFNGLDETVKDRLAKELANFFKVLHNIQLKTSIEGLEIDKKEKCRKEYEAVKAAAYPKLNEYVRKQIDTIYENILNCDFTYTKSLVHNDFGASNVFFDTATNKICGIVDFGDIAIYDRDIDFICLLHTQEEGFDQKFVDKVIDYYECENLNSIHNKSDFITFSLQLSYIWLAHTFNMKELLDESIDNIKDGISDFENYIEIEKNYINYI